MPLFYNTDLVFYRTLDLLILFVILVANLPLVYRLLKHGRVGHSQRKLVMLVLALHDLFLTLGLLILSLITYTSLSQKDFFNNCARFNIAQYWHFVVPGFFALCLIVLCLELIFRKRLRAKKDISPSCTRSILIILITLIPAFILFFPMLISSKYDCKNGYQQPVVACITLMFLAVIGGFVVRLKRFQAEWEYSVLGRRSESFEQAATGAGAQDEKICLSEQDAKPASYSAGQEEKPPEEKPAASSESPQGEFHSELVVGSEGGIPRDIVELLVSFEKKSLLMTSLAVLFLTLPHHVKFLVSFSDFPDPDFSYDLLYWLSMARPVVTPIIWIFNDVRTRNTMEKCRIDEGGLVGDGQGDKHGQAVEFNDLNTLYSLTGNLDAF